MLVPRKLRVYVEHHEGDEIRLTIPATASAVRIARVGAAGLGTRLGFSFAEVEELRLAVGEAAALLTGARAGADVLDIAYDVEAEGLRVTLTLREDEGQGPLKLPDVSELTSTVLGQVVDAWEVDASGSRILLYKVPLDPGRPAGD